MPEAISNTSPLLYLHRIGALHWLRHLFDEVWTPSAVVDELQDGRRRGFDAPDPAKHPWIQIVQPRTIPEEWLALDLGRGELAAMALARENPNRIVLLDDGLARRTARNAGLWVCGTLKIMLEAKTHGVITTIEPWVQRLADAGLWFSDDLRIRILVLAGEARKS
jgi:predicted nucleic acid-binding protein